MTACDPATLRALAARVMACANNEDVPWTEVTNACFPRPLPGTRGVSYDRWRDIRLHIGALTQTNAYLDAAAALFAPLRERGWEMDVNIRSGRAYAAAWHGNIDLTEIIDGAAPDEPAARVAMALLCRAAEGEATP